MKLDFNYITQIMAQRTILANAMLTLANQHVKKREYPQARELFQQAITLVPNDKMIWVSLGEVWVNLGRTDRAMPCYKQALALDPNFYPVWLAMSDCSVVQKKPKQALRYLAKAEILIDDSPNAQGTFYTARGNAYYDLNEFDKSERDFLKAIELRPDYAVPHGNLGNVYFARHEYDKSYIQYKKAFDMTGDPTMSLNIAIQYLLLGDYKQGWEWYEKRALDLKHLEFNRFQSRPMWKGEKTDILYIVGEQGMGDIIHFARYFKEAKKRCKKLIIETQKAWIPLIEQFEGPDEIIPFVNEFTLNRDLTSWLPLMSLPVTLGMPFPQDFTPYLEMNTIEPKKRPAIALFWQGNKEHNNDKQRSIPLEVFRPLIEAYPEVYWFTCHPEKEITAQIEASKLPIEQPKGDILTSARRLGEADLVIGCDTGPMHISGAQGVPTWILLPPNPDWRWGLETTSTFWYKSVRLYRSQKRREWSIVVAQVIDDLKDFLDELRKEHQKTAALG